MKPATLKQWCEKRRGRAAALAKLLDKSREFVRQMGTADRPIPGDILKLLPVAIKKIEADEKAEHDAAVARIKAGGDS